jgi:small subunit ribosomal protein S19e
MARVYDVDPSKLVEKLASELKNIETIKAPEWAKFVKTGSGKERPPSKEDWWYFRSASVLRKVFVSGPIGVSKLRKKYSSKKNRGHKPDKVFPSGGNILRKILQQLEKSELLKYVEKGVHKGRIVTGKGEKLMNKAANSLVEKTPKAITGEEPLEKKEPIKEVQEKKDGSGPDKAEKNEGASS